jgi:hypothetical protein
MLACLAQPRTLREYTSITIARYSQPDQVGMYVRSATHSLWPWMHQNPKIPPPHLRLHGTA